MKINYLNNKKLSTYIKDQKTYLIISIQIFSILITNLRKKSIKKITKNFNF